MGYEITCVGGYGIEVKSEDIPKIINFVSYNHISDKEDIEDDLCYYFNDLNVFNHYAELVQAGDGRVETHYLLLIKGDTPDSLIEKRSDFINTIKEIGIDCNLKFINDYRC